MNRYMSWRDTNIVEQIIKQLKANRIVASTSDTVIGLLAPLSHKGLLALNTIKGRSDKPYLILIGTQQQAHLFTDALHTKKMKHLIEQFWPGPLTIIVPAKSSVPSYAQSQYNTVALRFPKHAQLCSIAQQMHGVFSTSANRTNMPIPQTIRDIDPDILKNVALVVDNDQQPPSKSSTILDCTGTTMRIIREGAYSADQLRPYIT